MDIDDQGHAADPRAMLLAELEDYVIRHRPCGQLTGDATEPEPSGYLVWVRSSCGVMFLRWVTPEEAEQEMMPSDLLTTRS